MIHKIRQGNELYVYCNGKLMYKRWIKEGYGMVFDKFGAFTYSLLLLLLPVFGLGQTYEGRNAIPRTAKEDSLNNENYKIWLKENGIGQAGGMADTSGGKYGNIPPTIYASQLLGIAQPYKPEPPQFERIDSSKCIVSYLINQGDGTYKERIVDAVKYDSVFKFLQSTPCTKTMGDFMSCAAIHRGWVEFRNMFKIMAEGREINRYKYYTFKN